MKTAKSIRKQYKATFILDTHKWTEPIEALIEQIKGTIAEIDGEVLEVKPLGINLFMKLMESLIRKNGIIRLIII